MIDFNDARKQDDPGIVCIVEYFDEEHTQAASYVVKLEDGKFEAKVFDMDIEDELSLGVHACCADAVRVIWRWSEMDDFRGVGLKQ